MAKKVQQRQTHTTRNIKASSLRRKILDGNKDLHKGIESKQQQQHR